MVWEIKYSGIRRKIMVGRIRYSGMGRKGWIGAKSSVVGDKI